MAKWQGFFHQARLSRMERIKKATADNRTSMTKSIALA
jgi:hypothetical protein